MTCAPRLQWPLSGQNTTQVSAEKPQLQQRRGTISGTLADDSTIDDPDLAQLTQAWPTLPVAVRSKILAMIRTASGEG